VTTSDEIKISEDRREALRYALALGSGAAIASALTSSPASAQTTADNTLDRIRSTKVLRIAVLPGELPYFNKDLATGTWSGFSIEMASDIAKLLDFPLMTDMRNPLTIAFHKAKRQADLLRPERPENLLSDRTAQLEYRDAVHEYVSAFDIAETEAIRRRRSDFSEDDQQRLARAQHLLRLAQDDAASPQERQNAYARASKELDGLIVLPAPVRTSIERRIAAAIEA